MRAFNTDGEELLTIDEGKVQEEETPRPKRERKEFSGSGRKSFEGKKSAGEKKSFEGKKSAAGKKSDAPKAPRRKLRDMFSDWENEAAWTDQDNTTIERRKKPRRS